MSKSWCCENSLSYFSMDNLAIEQLLSSATSISLTHVTISFISSWESYYFLNYLLWSIDVTIYFCSNVARSLKNSLKSTVVSSGLDYESTVWISSPTSSNSSYSRTLTIVASISSKWLQASLSLSSFIFIFLFITFFLARYYCQIIYYKIFILIIFIHIHSLKLYINQNYDYNH